MNNLTAILFLFVLVSTLTVDADESKGSFNLSGYFDPGFTIGHGVRNAKHRSHGKEGDGDENPDDAVEWPNPSQYQQFSIPETYSHGETDGPENIEAEPEGHHGKHSKNHKYNFASLTGP